MFPTTIHSALIRYAFQEGGSGNGGLSASEVSHIDYGSKLTDTLFGTGRIYDLPITLLISEAPKHAMTPEGMSVEEAMKRLTNGLIPTRAKPVDGRKWWMREIGDQIIV